MKYLFVFADGDMPQVSDFGVSGFDVVSVDQLPTKLNEITSPMVLVFWAIEPLHPAQLPDSVELVLFVHCAGPGAERSVVASSGVTSCGAASARLTLPAGLRLKEQLFVVASLFAGGITGFDVADVTHALVGNHWQVQVFSGTGVPSCSAEGVALVHLLAGPNELRQSAYVALSDYFGADCLVVAGRPQRVMASCVVVYR